jgi:uncharacterized protein
MLAFARALALIAALCWTLVSPAQLPVPPLSGHVVDQAGMLSEAQRSSLEATLTAFEARKGSQLAVLIVPSTAPEPIEQFAIRVAEQWKLGRKKVDDGAILVIVKDDRALRIEVGYGLEGVLNDATSRRVIDEVIVPRFRQQDFAGGIAAGVDRITRVIDGEPLPPPQPGLDAGNAGDFMQYLPVIIVAVLVAGAALRALLGRLPGALATGALAGVAVWWLAGAATLALAAAGAAALLTLTGDIGWLRIVGLRTGGGRNSG